MLQNIEDILCLPEARCSPRGTRVGDGAHLLRDDAFGLAADAVRLSDVARVLWALTYNNVGSDRQCLSRGPRKLGDGRHY